MSTNESVERLAGKARTISGQFMGTQRRLALGICVTIFGLNWSFSKTQVAICYDIKLQNKASLMRRLNWKRKLVLLQRSTGS